MNNGEKFMLLHFPNLNYLTRIETTDNLVLLDLLPVATSLVVAAAVLPQFFYSLLLRR